MDFVIKISLTVAHSGRDGDIWRSGPLVHEVSRRRGAMNLRQEHNKYGWSTDKYDGVTVTQTSAASATDAKNNDDISRRTTLSTNVVLFPLPELTARVNGPS